MACNMSHYTLRGALHGLPHLGELCEMGASTGKDFLTFAFHVLQHPTAYKLNQKPPKFSLNM